MMKIGVFDSGLGGLVIAHSLIEYLPQYDYVYLGDTARVPYGNRSQDEILHFTEQGVGYLLNHGCKLVIVACNSASSQALRKIQQELIVAEYPDAKVLGVLIPAAEAAVEATKNKKIGVLATSSTVMSGAFLREIRKLLPEAQVWQQAAPLLVPLLEREKGSSIETILTEYLQPLLNQQIDTLILGCTHYPLMKKQARAICSQSVTVISQDEVIPTKLKDYFNRHPEIESVLETGGSKQFLVTTKTPNAQSLAHQLFGLPVVLKEVNISDEVPSQG